MVTEIIQTIIAPVVMVDACAILLGGLLNHSAAIDDRLRGWRTNGSRYYGRGGWLPPIGCGPNAWMKSTPNCLICCTASAWFARQYCQFMVQSYFLTVLESRQSQRAIRFEVQRVLALPRS